MKLMNSSDEYDINNASKCGVKFFFLTFEGYYSRFDIGFLLS